MSFNFKKIHFPQASIFNKKRVLITGANGLIGSHFVRFFEDLKSELDIDLIITSKSGIFNFKIPRDCTNLVGNLTEIEFLKKIPKADFIFHTAGYGQPNKFQVLPFETILLNTQILIYLLNSLKDQGKLLYCSSSEIYAGLETPPFNENQIGALNLNHPRSAYVESKKIGEIIVSNFNKQVREKTAVAARISLAYGPGYKDGDSRALNSFIDSALLNKQIRLKDSGTAQRTYCYITDTIEMCLNILINGSESVYNVGGVASISIKELANLIGKLTNVDVEITNTTEAYMPEAPVNVSLDMKKTLSICKKNEFVDLQSGLIETINWRKENLIRVFP